MSETLVLRRVRSRCPSRVSSASISSTVGRLPLNSSGSFLTILVSHSATPIGFLKLRRAYSTTSLLFERHRRSPIDGLSSICRSRSSTAEKVEQVGVLENLGGHIRIGGWQGCLEVCDRPALAFMEVGFDLDLEYVVGPAMHGTLTRVPEAFLWTSTPLQQSDMVIPGYSCKNLLHNCPFRPGRRKGPHVLQVAGRQAAHIGECLTKILRKTVNNPGAPAFALLPLPPPQMNLIPKQLPPC